MSAFSFRPALMHDETDIYNLYRRVAVVRGGLAREAHEVTPDYVHHFLSRSLSSGLSIVALDNENCLGEIHAYKPGINVFDHVLSELTIAVDPAAQGHGIGKQLFSIFLEAVRTSMPSILRVELIARESNAKAIRMYEKLGFVAEGRFENRIRSIDGGLEADIPMAWMNPNYKG
ncbi:MAG TPA: GNAT family N-acetyltransferase [bacterium]|nr:GNAT family N-acetyltransferase [bacterium]